jgi:hypothetical protein
VTGLSEQLRQVHDELGDEPLPERFEEASCGPHAKHLAHVALHAAGLGSTQEEWRAWVTQQVPEASSKLIAEAEECMRTSGTWPWNNPTRPDRLPTRRPHDSESEPSSSNNATQEQHRGGQDPSRRRSNPPDG